MTFIPRWEALYQLTFGPKMGYFTYMPVMLLGISGAVRKLHQGRQRAEATLVGAIWLLFLGYAASYAAWSASAFGPRFLVSTIPFTMLLVAMAWDETPALLRWGLAVPSLFINWLGVQFFERGTIAEPSPLANVYWPAFLQEGPSLPLARAMASKLMKLEWMGAALGLGPGSQPALGTLLSLGLLLVGLAGLLLLWWPVYARQRVEAADLLPLVNPALPVPILAPVRRGPGGTGPRVSVIIPARDAAHFLPNALRSVETQGVAGLEVWVVDDGSTDGTRDLVNNWTPRVNYLYQAPTGPAAARNAGIRQATGEYVAFLDADDIWLPEKLSRQLAALDASPEAAMCVTGYVEMQADGRTKSYVEHQRRLHRGCLLKNLFLRGRLCLPSVVARRSLFERVGLFEESLYIAEDWNLWLRVAANERVLLIPDPLVLLRRHQTNVTRDIAACVAGVRKSIEILRISYPETYARVQPWIPRLQAILLRDLAYQHLERGEHSSARTVLRRSLSLYPWDWRAVSYAAVAALPLPWAARGRWLKGRLTQWIRRRRMMQP